MILMLLACIFLRRFPDFFWHNLRWLDAGCRSMAIMLQIQLDVVMANIEDKTPSRWMNQSQRQRRS
jgi:hypothetical protein